MENEIVLYQPDELTKLEVRVENETVWLSQQQMAELFHTTKQNVSLHINNIFKEGELQREVVVKDFLTTTEHGAIPGKTQSHIVTYYNLDTIISVGYRVKSIVGTRFRQWATSILKAIHDRFLIIDDVVYHIGASIKDLGKRLFAFSKMEMEKEGIMKYLQLAQIF